MKTLRITFLLLAFVMLLGACATNKSPTNKTPEEEIIEEKTFPEKGGIPEGGLENLDGKIIEEWQGLGKLEIDEFYDRTKDLSSNNVSIT